MIADGLDGIVAAVEELTALGNMFVYTDIHAVLGEGNFVLTESEGQWERSDARLLRPVPDG
jgi:hypothetical protein